MNGLETKVTQKGQVTIPLEVRKRLGIKPRDTVRFEIEGDVVRLSRGTSRIQAGYGSVTPQNRPEDFQTIRERMEQAIAEEVIGMKPQT